VNDEPVRAALAAAGARVGPRLGRDAVLSFGDVARETVALASGAGVVPLLGLSTHAVSGTDAASFLHRMLTQDVRSIAVGDARPSLLLDARGKVQGDLIVWRTVSGFLLVQEPRSASRSIPSLERYVIADDVAFREESGSFVSFLEAGTRSLDASTRSTLETVGVLAARVDLRDRVAARILAPSSLAAAIVDVVTSTGAVFAGEEALDAARVETLTPWFGAELDDRVIPNEAGATAAISWTKGCYLGQEPVVMAKHRGRPPHRLVRVTIGREAGAGAATPDRVPARDEALTLAGRPVGRVTTAARARAGGVEALALVRTDHAKVGVSLGLDDGGSATIEAVADS